MTGNQLQHLAIIMDGNGRYAKQLGKNRLSGHKKGVKAVELTIKNCLHLQIPYLTLYVFSTENWNRPQDEVSGLMQLLAFSLKKQLNKLVKQNIRLSMIGNMKKLPKEIQQVMTDVIEATKKNNRLHLILSISYGSREELVQATRILAQKVAQGKLHPKDIDETLLAHSLYTAGIPDPDLLIRTGGERRLSNFLLYQLAYTELYFTDTLWPNFDAQELQKAMEYFQQRERRMGKISEQLV